MNAEHVEVLVEERSMGALLQVLLPKLLGTTTFVIHEHRCKADLLKCLPQRLRGYSWLPPTSKILVVVDRDKDDCLELKARLEQAARAAGLSTRSSSAGADFRVVNRIVVEELEAWYFGDWEAVTAAYPKVGSGTPRQASFRDPDRIAGGTWEAFERLLQKAGYFKTGGLRKVEAAREIAPHMSISRNTSRSFQALVQALVDICGIAPRRSSRRPVR